MKESHAIKENNTKSDIDLVKKVSITLKKEPHTLKKELNTIKKEPHTKSELDILKENAKALRNNSKILRKDANTIQNDWKILRKEINNIIKGSHAIKDNDILHRKKINDTIQAKINNDVSSEKGIHEQFLYPKSKDKLSNELK